jgi:hypothetical protein
MAGHLPIATDDLVIKVMKSFKKKHNIKQLKPFERIPHGLSTIQRLSSDYAMDDEHGLIDDEIIAINYQDRTLEVHLDKDEKINQVYLVM